MSIDEKMAQIFSVNGKNAEGKDKVSCNLDALRELLEQKPGYYACAFFKLKAIQNDVKSGNLIFTPDSTKKLQELCNYLRVKKNEEDAKDTTDIALFRESFLDLLEKNESKFTF